MLLVDTGASMTCVDRALLVALGAPVIGDTMVQTPSGSELQQLFACGIAFPGSNVPSINKLTVCGSNLSKQGIIGLLGRDVLSRALLIYNGIGGFWTLSM